MTGRAACATRAGTGIAAAGLAGVARAQGANPGAIREGTAGMGFVDVFDRLDPTALALLVAALAIVLLVVWRVVAMVRRERSGGVTRNPTREPLIRGRGVNTVTGLADPLSRNTLGGETDWGFDQNKRSAVGRRDDGRGLAPLDSSTRMPTGADAGVATPDAFGQSPSAQATGQSSPYRTGINPYFLRSELVESRIDVTEVADVVTQAELLVQLGDPKEAMNVLSRHIRETEKPGPQVWLMLLDLYRSTGREAQYNALAEGFRALFNAAVPPWPAGPEDGERWLEDYPQVLRKTIAEWPTPACRSYLERLLNDDRGGSRQGFSLAAYRDLLFLVDVLDARAQIDHDDVERVGIDRKLNA